jgi:hypothetical protein
MDILSLLILAVAGIGRTRQRRANGHNTYLSINLKGLRGRDAFHLCRPSLFEAAKNWHSS